MKRQTSLPQIVDKDEAEIRQIISLIKDCALSDEVKTFVIKCIELALWFPLFLQKKSISLHRLRVMVFGKGYNKDNKNNSNKQSESPIALAPEEPAVPSAKNEANLSSPNTDPLFEADLSVKEPDMLSINDASIDKEKKPGHGRMPHTVYNHGIEIQLLLSLTVGDDCPALCGGKLGDYNTGIIIRIKGQNFAQVYRYFVEKLRCNLCGIIIQAEIPPEVGNEKYDASFKAILALMKYYMAVPFYRQENYQRMLGFPLSDATQWDLIEQLAGYCYAPFNKLKEYAANGHVIQHDDTTLRN